jgi:hypothetical protein
VDGVDKEKGAERAHAREKCVGRSGCHAKTGPETSFNKGFSDLPALRNLGFSCAPSRGRQIRKRKMTRPT